MTSVPTSDLQLRWLDAAGAEHATSLFGLFAALARGEVVSLPGLRPHQREPWHAFSVQIAALALIAAGSPSIPADEDAWRRLLLALTPDWPDGEAWSLVGADWRQPALLQPPVMRDTDRSEYRASITAPDALDMLVTSRNHDTKSARMQHATDEDWFFALLTLQTTEGYLGAGNFGISRMNGGFASRMVLGLRPAGGLAQAWRRDVSCLIAHAKGRPPRPQGMTLLWLSPWDGTTQLAFGKLDPLYVEICRRVRLERLPGGPLRALAAGSKVARVAAAAQKGVTDDPWAPVRADVTTSITPTASGFGYRQITRLLQPTETARPLLATSAEDDPEEGMTLVAAALVRGQGKTEGLHRRTIPISRIRREKLRGAVFLDRVGEVAGGRTTDAGEVGRRLRYALLALLQGGPETVRRDDKAGADKAEPWLRSFDREVDRVFFDQGFWAEIAHEAEAPRLAWRKQLRALAGGIFEQAADAAPRTAERRIRARAVARNILDGSLSRFVEDTADGA